MEHLSVMRMLVERCWSDERSVCRSGFPLSRE
jgi:hypothetical protein